jgi:hypothetical protein
VKFFIAALLVSLFTSAIFSMPRVCIDTLSQIYQFNIFETVDALNLSNKDFGDLYKSEKYRSQFMKLLEAYSWISKSENAKDLLARNYPESMKDILGSIVENAQKNSLPKTYTAAMARNSLTSTERDYILQMVHPSNKVSMLSPNKPKIVLKKWKDLKEPIESYIEDIFDRFYKECKDQFEAATRDEVLFEKIFNEISDRNGVTSKGLRKVGLRLLKEKYLRKPLNNEELRKETHDELQRQITALRDAYHKENNENKTETLPLIPGFNSPSFGEYTHEKREKRESQNGNGRKEHRPAPKPDLVEIVKSEGHQIKEKNLEFKLEMSSAAKLEKAEIEDKIVAKQIEEALEMISKDPKHPGLQSRNLMYSTELWSSRAGESGAGYRIVWSYGKKEDQGKIFILRILIHKKYEIWLDGLPR